MILPEEECKGREISTRNWKMSLKLCLWGPQECLLTALVCWWKLPTRVPKRVNSLTGFYLHIEESVHGIIWEFITHFLIWQQYLTINWNISDGSSIISFCLTHRSLMDYFLFAFSMQPWNYRLPKSLRKIFNLEGTHKGWSFIVSKNALWVKAITAQKQNQIKKN